MIVNDATGQATSTPAATATQAPVATATQEPAPTATQAPVATSTPTVTSMATATPTQDPSIIAPPPGSCNDYVNGTSGSSGRAPEECDYPKLDGLVEWRVCDYEMSIRDAGGDVRSQPDLDVEHIAVWVIPVEDVVYPTSILDWIATNDVDAGLDAWNGYGVEYDDFYSRWLVTWNAPISLLGPLSRHPDVWLVYPIPQPSRDEQSSSNSGWVPTNAPSIHGAGLWQNNTPAVDGTGVKVGIIDSGFDGIQELLRSKGITATPTVNCVFDDDPNNDEEFFCEPGLHGESHEAHGAHVAEALLSIAPNVDLYLARAGGFQTVEKATKWLMTELADPVDVINVSLGYHFDSGSAGEPDNDESVLASVATAVAGGAVWVNSAGNRAGHQNVFHADVPNAPNEYSSQWDNNWLKLHDGSFFVPVELEQSDRNVRFRLRWGAEDRDNPPRLHLFACDNNGCAATREVGTNAPFGARIKQVEWQADSQNSSEVFLRVCREPGGGDVSWVEMDVSSLIADFPSDYNGYRSLNSAAESKSPGMLAVGAAVAAVSGSSVSYELNDGSSRGPTADERPKPDVVGVNDEPSTILATQVAEGTYSPTHYPGGRWPGTSQAAPTATQAPVATATPDPDSTATPVTEVYECGPIDDGASTRDDQQSEANTGYERLWPGALQDVLTYERAIAEGTWGEEFDGPLAYGIDTVGDQSAVISFLEEHELYYQAYPDRNYILAMVRASLLKQLSNLPGVELVYITSAGGQPASNVPSSDVNGGSIAGNVAATAAATPTFVPEVFLHGADEWREATYDGGGIKVGIIDSGLMSIDHLMDEELM